MSRITVALLSSLLAWQAIAAPKKSSEKAKEEAREQAASLFAQSKAFYNIHEYERALVGFKEAYLLSQEPVLILNIGQCYRYLGQYQDALLSYQTFLQEEPDTQYRANVERLIAEMQLKLATLTAPDPVVAPSSRAQLPPPVIQAEEPYRAPGLLYGATVAAFTLGLGSGGLAVVLSRKEEEILLTGDQVALAANEQRQRISTGAAIGMASAGVVSATAGYLLFRRHKNKKELPPMEPLLDERAPSGL